MAEVGLGSFNCSAQNSESAMPKLQAAAGSSRLRTLLAGRAEYHLKLPAAPPFVQPSSVPLTHRGTVFAALLSLQEKEQLPTAEPGGLLAGQAPQPGLASLCSSLGIHSLLRVPCPPDF